MEGGEPCGEGRRAAKRSSKAAPSGLGCDQLRIPGSLQRPLCTPTLRTVGFWAQGAGESTSQRGAKQWSAAKPRAHQEGRATLSYSIVVERDGLTEARTSL